MTVLCTQHQQREETVEELRDKAERVTGIIHIVHHKVHDVAA